MKIALRAFSLSSSLDSSETPENFSSTAFHSPCNTRDDFILIFHKLKLVPLLNFGTSYFVNDADTLLDAISPQFMPKSPIRQASPREQAAVKYPASFSNETRGQQKIPTENITANTKIPTKFFENLT